MEQQQTPVLRFLDQPISFPLNSQQATRIGYSCQCDLIIEEKTRAGEYAVIQYNEGEWELTGSENHSVLLNNKQVTSRECLQEGDKIVIGEAAFCFSFLTLPTSQESFATLAPPEVLEESATETLTIVQPAPERWWPRGLSRQVIVALGFLAVAGLSWLLATGQFSYYRQEINRQDSVASSAPSPSISKEPGVFPRLEWLQIREFSVVQIAHLSSEVQQAQNQVLEKFRQGKYQQAEEIYLFRVYRTIQRELKQMENVLKYNGWLFRWLAMLERAKKEGDSSLLHALEKELEVFRQQVSENLYASPYQERFRKLAATIEQQISQTERK